MASRATGIVDDSSNDAIVEVVAEHGQRSGFRDSYNMVVLACGLRAAQCKMCRARLATEESSILRRHAEKTCPGLKSAEGDSSRPVLDGQGEMWTLDADLNRKMTTQCVIQEGSSFGDFDSIHIANMIKQVLQPRYDPVSRQTLRCDAIKLWKTCRNEMRQMFSLLPNCVSLTCDVWSAQNGIPLSYICITAHWVEPQSWQLVKRVITFELFGEPYPGGLLSAIIKRNLKFYNLDQKVISISFDNASYSTKCVSKLLASMKPILNGQLFHTRCFARTINLIIQDCINTVKPVLDKFRLMLTRIFVNGKKMQALYRKYCKGANCNALMPHIDIPTGWDSTYFMIETLLKQKECLHAFYRNYYPRNSIGVLDWGLLDGLYDIFSEIKKATTLLSSGVYYPTSPLLLNQIFILASKMAQYEDNRDWGGVVQEMKPKLLKYFLDIPFSFKCAAALNPYLNVTGVEVLISNICSSFGLNAENDDYAKEEICKFNQNFKDLFHHYKRIYDGTSEFTLDSDLDELNIYMGTNFISFSDVDNFESIDLLEWWKQKQSQFPVLATLARDILTIQASTVASESVFSFTGRIISDRRTTLSPRSMECCICLKDYLDSNERTQHKTSLEMELKGVEENLEEIESSEDFTLNDDYEDEEEFDPDELGECLNEDEEEFEGYTNGRFED